MTDQRGTTIRQGSEQAIELEAIARVVGIPVAEVIRTALAEDIQTSMTQNFKGVCNYDLNRTKRFVPNSLKGD